MVRPITAAKSYVSPTGKSMKAVESAVSLDIASRKAQTTSHNFLAGKGAITGDVVFLAISREDWRELR